MDDHMKKQKAKAEGPVEPVHAAVSGQPDLDDTVEFEGAGADQSWNMHCSRKSWAASALRPKCSTARRPTPATWKCSTTTAPPSRRKWLKPLMNGEIRSAFLMTEPAVASSDATNIETSIKRDGDDYVINGRKWWSSGVGDPRCKVAIVMGKTDPGRKAQQQSQILVPLDAPGVTILRMLPCSAMMTRRTATPKSCSKMSACRPPTSARRRPRLRDCAGPPRAGPHPPLHAHHRRRGSRAREDVQAPHDARRVRQEDRRAFGVGRAYRRSPHDIEMTRLLCLKAADMMDKVGNKGAQNEIAMIKVAAPRMALKIIDDAIQAHGGGGV
jgi:acyl-CoA dehydrogenase